MATRTRTKQRPNAAAIFSLEQRATLAALADGFVQSGGPQRAAAAEAAIAASEREGS